MAEPSEGEPAQRSPVFWLAPFGDIVLRPARAYDGILAKPAWLPAFLFVVACSLLDLRLSAPALWHVVLLAAKHHAGAAYSAGDPSPGSRKEFFVDNALVDMLQPLVAWSLTAIVASTVARFKRVAVPYSTFFALAALCAVPSALGGVVTGVATALRPVASYATLKALAVAAPDNLAIFASSHNDREVAFFSNFGLFDVWSSLLLAYGLVAFAKLRITTGLGIALGLDLVIALLFGP